MRRHGHTRKITRGEPPAIYTPVKLAADVAHGEQTTAQVEAFNAQIGPRKLDRTMFFTTWSLPIVQTYSQKIAEETATTEIIVAWQPTTWSTVLSGAKDAYLKEQCDRAKALALKGLDLIVRLAHEFNGNWKVGFGSFTETAEEFIAKWRYVVNFFKAEGVTNVKWAWNPNTWGTASTMDPTTYYPGSEYVHVVGLDSYMKREAAIKQPSEIFSTFFASLASIAPGKDRYIFETACAEDPRFSKAAWITNLGALVKLLGLAGVGWWNRFEEGDNNSDYTIDSSGTNSASLAAFQAMVNNPVFV